MPFRVKLLRMTKPRLSIKLEEHTISDSVTGYSRSVRLLRSPLNNRKGSACFSTANFICKK